MQRPLKRAYFWQSQVELVGPTSRRKEDSMERQSQMQLLSPAVLRKEGSMLRAVRRAANRNSILMRSKLTSNVK